MEQKIISVFDERDDEVISLLVDLGLKRNTAKVFAYIHKCDGSTSLDIEQGARMRQPEVSLAARELFLERGWIQSAQHRHSGKGRPFVRYSLKDGFNSILGQFAESRLEELEKIKCRVNNLLNSDYCETK